MPDNCAALKKLIKDTPEGVAKQYLERAYELMGCDGVTTQGGGGQVPTSPPPTPPSPPNPPTPPREN